MAIANTTALVALILTGAIFGFFFAYVCSAMWGLDAADPRVAIPAMQEINAAVQNLAFFPTFFLTPAVLGLAAVLYRAQGAGEPAAWFAVAALVYLLGGLVLTVMANVPMNTELAALETPESLEEARAIWEGYSPRWQLFNLLRTIASGVALLCVGVGLLKA